MSPYWVCQLVGWSLEGFVSAVIPTLFGGLRWAVVARALVGVILGIVFTDQLRSYIHRNGWLKLPLHRLAPRLVLASLAIAAAMVLALTPFLVRFIPPDRTAPIATVFAGHTAVILGWCGIYVAVHYLRGLRAAEAEKWRLELAVRDPELRARRAQRNP